MRIGHVLAMFVVAAFAAVAPTPPRAETAPIAMKLACPTLNDVAHEWLKRYGAAIETMSGGRIRPELYPAGQLGSIPRMVEGTQLGSIQLLIVPPEFLVGLDQRFELLSAAGLFEDGDHAIRTISDPEFSKIFLSLGANKGLFGAGLFMVGSQAFATRQPLRTLADFKGKKIRIFASQFQTEQVARLGATGVPMSLGDVLPALQQGTIDGALGSLQVFTGFAYYDTARYINETNHAYVLNIAVISRRWFDAQPADLKPMIMAAARETTDVVYPWQVGFLARQRETWVARGGEIDTLPAADKAEMMARLSPIGGEIVKAKPELKPVWDELVETAKRVK